MLGVVLHSPCTAANEVQNSVGHQPFQYSALLWYNYTVSDKHVHREPNSYSVVVEELLSVKLRNKQLSMFATGLP